MNGADSVIGTLVNCGVRICFSNPGTSELHLVAALDSHAHLRPVLCLFEGVATGAADGYARITGTPAATLLHLGPGLANGLSSLHNARRACSPVINIVGNHATHHLQYDAPLTSDIEGLARPVSAWIYETRNARSAGSDTARAVQAARSAPGQIATLIVPADAAWNPADACAPPLPPRPAASVSSETVDNIARQLGGGRKAALLLRGGALVGAGLEAAGRIRSRTGARLLCDTLAPTAEAGAGRVVVERIPYFADSIVETLRGLELLVLVGAEPPVSFFAYPGKPGWCAPTGCEITYLSHPHEDATEALQSLATAVGAQAQNSLRAELQIAPLPTGALTAVAVAQMVAHWMPEQAIVADDAISSRGPLLVSLASARSHTHLTLPGGSIGQGISVAAGASLAAPDRKVLCMQGDGGAAYMIQALWTLARERLDVTTVVFSNRSYAILNLELQRFVPSGAGARALSLLDLGSPEIDWARIASGFGVEASRARTCEEFAAQFESAMRSRGPRLIEAIL